MDTKSAMRMWAASMSAQKLSQRTIIDRTSLLERLAASAGVEALELTSDHIIAFIGARHLGRSSAATYLAHVRAFFRWAAILGLRVDDPTLVVPKPKRTRGTPKPLATEKVPEVISLIRRRKTKMMVLLGLYAGLRAHEIAKFRGEDINLESREITVTGKGGETQVVPLHDEIAKLAHSFPEKGWWFPSPKFLGPVSRQHVSSTVGRLFRKAGINQGSAHRLRHSYGSEQTRVGVDLRVVQENMRHLSIQSTQIYTKVDDRQRRAAINLLRYSA